MFIPPVILLCLDQAHSNLQKRKSSLIIDGNPAALKVYVCNFYVSFMVYAWMEEFTIIFHFILSH